MKWILFFWFVFKSVLFSTGGFGPLPSLHNDFIAQGLAGEKQFTEALSIGQLTPGPNGLWVVSLCYLTGGIPGAVLSCIALLLPPLLIVVVQRCYTRIGHHPATKGLMDGVVLVISGFSVVTLVRMFIDNGVNIPLAAVAVISAVLAITRKVSSNIILIAAALMGFVFG